MRYNQNLPNQQVFIDLTAGTMTAARTNGSGLLVTGTGAGTPVPLDDTRDYSVIVVATAPPATPAASAGTRLRVSGGRLTVSPHIAIRVTNATGAAVAGLACTMSIGAANSTVSTSRTGWIISNDQTPGSITLSTADRLLRSSAGTVPAVMLALAAAPLQRGSNGRINLSTPAGTVDLRVKRWQCVVSHTNPNGTVVTSTITRPASEAPATFHQFWEGRMCASGVVTARFVTGASVRIAGAGSVSETLVAMDPQDVTLNVTIAARPWTTTLTQLPESTFTRPIMILHDTAQHDWTTPAHFGGTPATVGAGPNRGCRFIDSTSGLAFTSNPQINADIVNLSSPFQTEQGSARVTAPPALAGRVIPRSFYTVSAGGAITITDMAGLISHFGVSTSTRIGYLLTECISPSELLAAVRRHEHTGPISHKQNCLRALRALEPAVFIEAFVEVPGATVDFGSLLVNRMTAVGNANPTHNEVDESATRTAGTLQLAGSRIPDVNITSSGNRPPVWDPNTARAFLMP